jgi:hypothetical protein
MVGDNLEWEIVAPQRLGIYAIWHDGYGVGLSRNLPIRPDRIIRRLSELLLYPSLLVCQPGGSVALVYRGHRRQRADRPRRRL